MRPTRRSFMRLLSRGGAGAISAVAITGRGREAFAATDRGRLGAPALPVDPRQIRLDSNENPFGPGPAALDAARAAFDEAGRYPDIYPADLTTELARFHGVAEESIVLGAGSGEILRMSVFACTSPARPLVAGLPTFEDPGRHAEVAGTPVRSVRVDAALKLDLAGMAREAVGAGLVFLCNPNNPTGTVHGSAAVNEFIATVNRTSPDTVVLVDEAYHHFVDDPSYASAIPVALANPRVVVCRTFSKVYGMAGLRVGYAIGQPEIIKALRRHKLPNSINALGAAAAMATIADKAHLERQQRLNRETRALTRRWFEERGFAVTPSHANFLMIDIRRDAKQFQADCRVHHVLVGRPFPPLLTHTRISMGTEAEMRRAFEVFAAVLGKKQ